MTSPTISRIVVLNKLNEDQPNGYQLCSKCGEVLVAGDRVVQFDKDCAKYYSHPRCFAQDFLPFKE